MQTITIIGYIGKDAEVKQNNANKFISFSVATTEKWKKEDGTMVENTQWYSCIINKGESGLLPYLKKGTQVYVTGNPRYNIYDTSDGKRNVGVTISVRDIQLLGGKKDNAGAQNENDNNDTPEDDLPF